MRPIGSGRKESWCCCGTNVLYPTNGGSKPNIQDKHNSVGGNACEIGYSTEQMLSRSKSDEDRAVENGRCKDEYGKVEDSIHKGRVSMDEVLAYLEYWKDDPKTANRLPTLIETYQLVRCDGRLAGWRFGPGKQRPDEKINNPMYCAFAATPFEGNDWFVLRLTRCLNDHFSIGFCPDYGIQDKRREPNTIITERRREFVKAIRELEKANLISPSLRWIPKADKPPQPHAFKGLERKLKMPGSAEELADEFVKTVLQWKELFETIGGVSVLSTLRT